MGHQWDTAFLCQELPVNQPFGPVLVATLAVAGIVLRPLGRLFGRLRTPGTVAPNAPRTAVDRG